MALYRRGRIWWVSVTRRGRRVQVSTKLTDREKAKSVEMALKLANRVEKGAVGSPGGGGGFVRGSPTDAVAGLLRAVYGDDSGSARIDALWGEYCDVMKVRGVVLSRKTLVDKENALRRLLEWCEGRGIRYVEQVDSAAAKRYALSLVQTCGVKRRENVLSGLSSVWNAVLPGHRGMVNPWPTVVPRADRSIRRNEFTREQEQAVLAAARRVHHQWYLACLIARHTGLRYGDVVGLEWANLDLSEGVLRVKPGKTQKHGITVVVPLAPVLAEELRKWLEAHPARMASDPVLPWMRNTGRKGKHKFSAVLEEAGLGSSEGFYFGSWRHTFRSRLAEAGVSTDVAMKLCGHTNAEMSQHYNHYEYIAEMRESIERAAR